MILKKNKPIPDTKLRDTENVPFGDDIDKFFEREVKPYLPDAWIDKKKTKVGYEIPMTKLFYEYQKPETTEIIVERLHKMEKEIQGSLEALFGGM